MTPVAIATIQPFCITANESSRRYNSVPVRGNCVLFAPTLYFWAWAIQWCHLTFSLPTPVVTATNFD